MPATVTFDHYEVLRRDDGSLHELGRGAMGITYKAFDTNLRVPVALKVINPAILSHGQARERFMREARAAAKLRHRHVASVFHLGSEGDTYFYAMEFIDGKTVEALVQRAGPLAPLLALRLILQVARALGAAEQHGLVHRDIKPANLMLVREDDEMVVKVIDFGLAHHASEGEDEKGSFAGTPHYASPEQLSEVTLDIRSDIYSLGATAWFMLSGQPPFSGSVEAVAAAHRETGLPWASLPEPSPPLETLLRRLLGKDAADRPQNAAELRQEIEACVEALYGGLANTASLGAIEEARLTALVDGPGGEDDAGGHRIGSIVADRYELVQALGETLFGRGYRAHDRQRGGLPVRLIILADAFAAEPALLTGLDQQVQLLAALTHPNLVRVHGLETVEGGSFLVTEWIEGFTLVDLLRARRELPVREALPLILEMAAGADAASDGGAADLDLALHQISIHFSGIVPKREETLHAPVSTWPPWVVKINPLTIPRELNLSQTWAGGRTIVGSPVITGGMEPEGPATVVPSLVAIAYELLGGAAAPVIAGGGGRFTPLAPLSEAGNAVLRGGLDPNGPFPRAGAWAAALQAAEAPHAGSFREGPAAPRHPGPASLTHGPAAPHPAIVPLRKKKPIPLAFVGGLLTVLGLGTAVIFLLRTPVQLMPEVAGAPARVPVSTPAPEPEAPPALAVEGLPEPAPLPPMTPEQDLVRTAVEGAEGHEAQKRWPEALAEWLRISREYPEPNSGRTRASLLLDQFRGRLAELTPEQWDAMLPVIREFAGQDLLPAMLILGEGLRESAPTDSFAWYSAAAARGNASALTQLGLMFSNGQGTAPDVAKAVECLTAAAEMNNAIAQSALGECYLVGKGVPKDELHAVELLSAAAGQGNLRAMTRLADCYHRGIGVKRDVKEAFRLFSKAADLGHPNAMANLGVLLISGDGSPKNERRAVELFQRGAESGDAFSMYLLASCYERGPVLTKDLTKAEEWYRRAAELGHPQAAEWCRGKKVAFQVRGSGA